MHSQFLTYDQLDSKIDDNELTTDTIVEIYSTYSDFFTLSLLDPDRLAKEVLATNVIMKGLAKAFDNVSQRAAHLQVNEEIEGYLPSKDYREDNIADNINFAYMNSLVGDFLETDELGGITIGDTEPLLDFFDTYKVHWKFIAYYEEELKAAAKTWYENHAEDIIEKNRKYRRQCQKENFVLAEANKLTIQLEDQDEKNRLFQYVKSQLDSLDTAQAHNAFKSSLDKKLTETLRMFNWGKSIRNIKFPMKPSSIIASPPIKNETESPNEKTTSMVNNQTLFNQPPSLKRKRNENNETTREKNSGPH